MPSKSPLPAETSTRTQSLGIWDTACLLIGIVVGTGIFKAPPLVFGNVPNVQTGLLVWSGGALLALCGALCYCELATTYPQFGAEYIYLSRAYGRRLGFLFAWMQLCVILTGNIGIMVFVFADYAATLSPALESFKAAIASTGLIALTLVHLCGIQIGKTLQNVLSLGKIAALLTILVIGVLASSPAAVPDVIDPGSSSNIGLALVFVLYAYGGWNDVAQVTPEVQNFQRNMPRALIMGLSLIALLYLGLNFAFYNVLGFDGLRQSQAPATEVVSLIVGRQASAMMSLIVMCSALGAVHGMLFASPRLLAAIGQDFRLFARWNQWSKNRVPTSAILTVMTITLVLVLAVGTAAGRHWTTTMTTAIGLPRPDWQKYDGGFGTLVAATAPIFWFFFALSGLAVIVLRATDPQTPRPFRIPVYPLPPIVFCCSAVFMFWKSFEYAGELTLLSLPVAVIGIVLSFTKKNDNLESGTNLSSKHSAPSKSPGAE